MFHVQYSCIKMNYCFAHYLFRDDNVVNFDFMTTEQIMDIKVLKGEFHLLFLLFLEKLRMIEEIHKQCFDLTQEELEWIDNFTRFYP